MHQHYIDQQDSHTDHYLLIVQSPERTGKTQNSSMRGKVSLGLSLLVVAASALAGGVSEQLSVNITLNTGPGSAASCVSASTSGLSSASVEVRCSSNVFVAIGPATATRTLQLVSGFQTSRDSLPPESCPDEPSRSDMARGSTCWSGDTGMVTALSIPHADRHYGPVEMLVSF